MSTPRPKFGHGASTPGSSVTSQVYDTTKSGLSASIPGNSVNHIDAYPNIANNFDLHFSDTPAQSTASKKPNPHVHLRSVLANGTTHSNLAVRSGGKAGPLTQNSSMSNLIMYIGTPITSCPHVVKIGTGKTVYLSIDAPAKVMNNIFLKLDIQVSQIQTQEGGKDSSTAEIWLSNKIQYAYPGEAYDSAHTSGARISNGSRNVTCKVIKGKKQYITITSMKGCTLTLNYSFYKQNAVKLPEPPIVEEKALLLANPMHTLELDVDGVKPWEMGAELSTNTSASARTVVSKKLQLLRSDEFMYSSFMAKVKETQAQQKAQNQPVVNPDSPNMIELMDIPRPDFPVLTSPTPLMLDLRSSDSNEEIDTAMNMTGGRSNGCFSPEIRKVNAHRHNMHVELVSTQSREKEKLKQEAFVVSRGIRTELLQEQKEQAEEHILKQLNRHLKRSWSVLVYYLMFLRHLQDVGNRINDIQSERKLTIVAVVNIQRVFRNFLARRNRQRTLERILRQKTFIGFLSAVSQATKRDRAADIIYMILRQKHDHQKTDNLTKAVRGYRRKVVTIQRAWRRTYLCRIAKLELWSLAWARYEAQKGSSGLQQRTIDMLLSTKHKEEIALVKEAMPAYYERLWDFRAEMMRQTTTRAVQSTVGRVIMPPMRPSTPVILSHEWIAEAIQRGQAYERELLIIALRNTSAPTTFRRSSTVVAGSTARRASFVGSTQPSIPPPPPPPPQAQTTASAPRQKIGQRKTELAKRSKK